MQNLALLTEYDGGCFHGWQQQAKDRSVQETLQHAWYKLTGEDVKLTGSSRTDAGVHALGHVANFFSSARIPLDKVPLAINTQLPAGVAVRMCVGVENAFNARFHACGKRYSYHIANSRIRPALKRSYQAHVPSKLDLEAMKQASQALLGEHDFTALMDQGSVIRDPKRTLFACYVRQRKQEEIVITVIGDGFLYHMVRIIAGTLVAVGEGKIKANEIEQLIANQDRTLLGKTMPAQGLFLEKVYYNTGLFGADSKVEMMNEARALS